LLQEPFKELEEEVFWDWHKSLLAILFPLKREESMQDLLVLLYCQLKG